MTKKRLLRQIYTPMMLVMITAMAGITWYATESLRHFYIEQTISDLTLRAELIKYQLTPVFQRGDHAALTRLCRQLAQQSFTRITIIDKTGQVLADSTEDAALMDNHADRAEVIEGLENRVTSSIRFSQTLNTKMLYLALPLSPAGAADDQEPTGVIRLSIPITSIDNTLDSVILKIIIGTLVLAFFAALITLTVSRRITRPLEKMRVSAERYADGELDETIRLDNEKNISLEMADLASALNQMASQLNSRLQTVTEQRNELKAVFSSMTEAVLAVDKDEKVVSINQAASRFLGLSIESAKGKPIHEILRNAELLRFVKTCLTTGEHIEREIVLRENGSETFFQAYGTFLCDAENLGTGALIVLNDITRLKRLQSMRSDFVANVSHELRTPITAIKGFVETLQDGALSCPEDAERFLIIIQRHADRLNAIVEDLLTLTRVEQDETEGDIVLESVCLAKVLHNAAETCAAQAQNKNITLSVHCPNDLKANLNERLMEQAIANLVINAVKYSQEHGEIRITAKGEARKVLITIRDFGIGISAEHLPRLFERFYRSDKARSRKLGGTGLGLAIVKHITKAHHGSVCIDSSPGKGTTFTIELPA